MLALAPRLPRAGTAWICKRTPEDCRIRPLRHWREGAALKIRLHREPAEFGYQDLFLVGSATPLLPAMARRDGVPP